MDPVNLGSDNMDVVDTLKSGEHSHGIAVAILTIATTNS
jgi:hypothetical protein